MTSQHSARSGGSHVSYRADVKGFDGHGLDSGGGRGEISPDEASDAAALQRAPPPADTTKDFKVDTDDKVSGGSCRAESLILKKRTLLDTRDVLQPPQALRRRCRHTRSMR